MAAATAGDQSRLLQKVIGGLEHGGGQVLKPDSTGYKILDRFVRRMMPQTSDPTPDITTSDYNCAAVL